MTAELLLTVDISNSSTGLAMWQGERVAHHWRIRSDGARTTDELCQLLRDLCAHEAVPPSAVGASVMACVVPELAAPMTTVCQGLFGTAPLVVGPGVRTGVAVRTDDPHEVGPDRVANAVSVIAKHGCPAMVLDFATALTIDVVDGAGAYAGAVIAPGLEVVAHALARDTAGLPRVDLSAPDRAIARDTATGLRSGLVLGYLGLIEGLVEGVRSTVGDALVVATGEAPWGTTLAAASEVVDAYDPMLTMDGLRRILHHNA